MTLVEEHDTPLGPARTHTTEADGAVRGTLVLGHGAGGGVESVDLVAVTDEVTGAWFPRHERVYPAVYAAPHVTAPDLSGVVDALLALPSGT